MLTKQSKPWNNLCNPITLRRLLKYEKLPLNRANEIRLLIAVIEATLQEWPAKKMNRPLKNSSYLRLGHITSNTLSSTP